MASRCLVGEAGLPRVGADIPVGLYTPIRAALSWTLDQSKMRPLDQAQDLDGTVMRFAKNCQVSTGISGHFLWKIGKTSKKLGDIYRESMGHRINGNDSGS